MSKTLSLGFLLIVLCLFKKKNNPASSCNAMSLGCVRRIFSFNRLNLPCNLPFKLELDPTQVCEDKHRRRRESEAQEGQHLKTMVSPSCKKKNVLLWWAVLLVISGGKPLVTPQHVSKRGYKALTRECRPGEYAELR